jgi:hypothetical protein
MAEPVFNSRVTDLASRIYVEFVGGATSSPEIAEKVQAEADRLARMSFRLAANFYHVLDELNAENEPKNVGFSVQLDDIAKWSVPAAKP